VQRVINLLLTTFLPEHIERPPTDERIWNVCETYVERMFCIVFMLLLGRICYR